MNESITKNSLVFQLTKKIFYTSFLASILVFLTMFAIDYKQFNDSLNLEIENQLQLIYNSASNAAYQLNKEDATNVIQGLLSNPNIITAEIYDNFGNLLSIKRNKVDYEFSNIFVSEETRVIKLFYQKSESIKEVGNIKINIYPSYSFQLFLKYFFFKILLQIVFICFIIFILSLIIYINVVQPLLKTSEQIQNIDFNNLPEKFKKITKKEVNEIDQINFTLEQLINKINISFQERNLAYLEVEKNNSNLENIIAQKTIELKQALTDLENKNNLAEKALKIKSEFLSIISHELKTPLNGILGSTELLKIEETDKSKIEFLDLIQTSGYELLRIINEILDFSQIDNGNLNMNFSSLNITQFLKLMENDYSLLCKEKNLKFTIKHFKNDTFIFVDEDRFKQAIEHLIKNAIKFTHQGQIEIHTSNNNNNIKISIIDSGIGIPFENQKELFKPFSQVDSSSTRNFGGTGLGLAICKNLIESMGGFIGFHSEENKGSTFWIEFKAQK